MWMMLKVLQDIKESLLHIAFPHVCEGCGGELPELDHLICLQCREKLPRTGFQYFPNNPVEKIFWGRVPLTGATAQFYFTKGSAMQGLMHELKYRGNKELGIYLGKMMGEQLAASNRFRFVDGLIPLPLFAAKKKKRGFNQAELLCDGMSETMGLPVFRNVVARTMNTETQTKKNRTERWLNMKGRFVLNDPATIAGKHVLLVDDVVTTGATLEACAASLVEGCDCKVSIATLCISSSS